MTGDGDTSMFDKAGKIEHIVNQADFNVTNQGGGRLRTGIELEAVISIQKIIDTMLDAGCDVCAGLMVAKQELTTTTVQTVPSKCRCPQSTICGTNSGHCEFFSVEDETCLYGKI